MNKLSNFSGYKKPIHFIGIGGIGMSGIAQTLNNLGYVVQGSDISHNYNTERLERNGIKIIYNHAPENVVECGVVVISSAVADTNPEVIEARRLKIPLIKRAEMLAELMRFKKSISIAGSHGKTTTTSLVGAVLEKALFDPTIINGGIINSLGTNAKTGYGDWIVAEADESDGTFCKLPTTIAVITNIDYEHLDHFGNIESIHKAFEGFASNVPFYGMAIICADNAHTLSIAKTIIDKRLVTYGFAEHSDIQAIDVRTTGEGVSFRVRLSDFAKNLFAKSTEYDGLELFLPLIGRHNAQNSLVAIAIGLELGVDSKFVVSALREFCGVKRRFTRVGHVNGCEIIDDYAHHPVEITAVLNAAREICVGQGKIYAIIQPHRYTRLQSLWEEFKRVLSIADYTFVTPVYTAGEPNIDGVDSINLVKSAGIGEYVEDLNQLVNKIGLKISKGDFVIFLGAGSITNWARDANDLFTKALNESKKT